jgi:Major capsid protein N-terminus
MLCNPSNALAEAETTLYIPLQFWFMKNPGLALPLIALQVHEVKINIQLRPIVVDCGPSPTCAPLAESRLWYKQSLVAASLCVDVSRRVTHGPHEYLIEQQQCTGEDDPLQRSS